MSRVWIIPIEPIDQRYTKQWYDNIPEDLRDMAEVYVIDGITNDALNTTTSGAFLNFAFTNAYKASQIEKIAVQFQNGNVRPGDKFLVTDAWNFAITAIRYMSDLLDVPVEIHGVWHAGNYDPSDILGMKMKGAWAANMERGWFHACDYNYFATEFHKNMFLNNLGIEKEHEHKAIRSGQPHQRIILPLLEKSNYPKKDIVIWPHRYNVDKQPDIAEHLQLMITQKMHLSKDDYYSLIGEAKAMFSCSLHENLGISMMEGCLAGAIPIVPDRCSYAEMYSKKFKYPSEWTSSLKNFEIHTQDVIDFIQDKVINYDSYHDDLERQKGVLITRYLTPTTMYRNLTR
jgi:hypothetical protein